MTQLLVRTSDGLVATAMPSKHAWGTCERWPTFVVLNIESEDAVVLDVIEANRDNDGLAHVALDSLSDQVVSALAKDDRATVPLRDLQFSTGAAPSKLITATVSRADEKVAFEVWQASLGEVGDAPADATKRAAEEAARAELVAKRGGRVANAAPPKKGVRA